MKQMTRKQYWLLALMLTLCCGTTMVSACSKDDEPSEQNEISAIADKIWDYSLSHPDGFTLDIRTMTEPSEGISVSYAGYVGGWLNSDDGLYYFDSDKVFPEDQLDEAIKFGKENGQTSVYILSTGTEVNIDEYLNE